MAKPLVLDGILEHRVLPLELRAEGDDDKPKITGHAAVFNKLSQEMWGFYEQIAPGAFKQALKSSDPRALFNHDPNYVLGRRKAGTLNVWEDDTGLAVEISPPDTQWARDLLVTIKRGDVNQMSFAFMVARSGSVWEEQGGKLIRTITKIEELRDVSLVTYPAYPNTDASVRSLLEVMNKAERGQPLEPEERELILASIERLKPLAGEEPSKKEEPRRSRLLYLRRRLELAEKEN